MGWSKGVWKTMVGVILIILVRLYYYSLFYVFGFRQPADLLWTGLEGVIQQRSGLQQSAESKQTPEKRCECQSPELKSCVCCLRMSLPLLDLTTSPGEYCISYYNGNVQYACNTLWYYYIKQYCITLTYRCLVLYRMRQIQIRAGHRVDRRERDLRQRQRPKRNHQG